MAKQKAIYRKGLGCTLIAEMSEEELRSQKINLPQKQVLNPDTIAWPMGNKLPDSNPPESTMKN